MSLTGQVYTTAVIGAGKARDEGFFKGGGHRIGYTHGETYGRSGRTRLVAVADINAENLHAYQETFDLQHGFVDYRAMLRDVQPDVVSICTYVGLHRQILLDACAAGVKGITCEKPCGDRVDLPLVDDLADDLAEWPVEALARRSAAI